MSPETLAISDRSGNVAPIFRRDAGPKTRFRGSWRYASCMVTPAAFRRAALRLPEAYEDLHRKRPAFRVSKRIFAMLGVTGNAALFSELDAGSVAVVKLGRDQQLDLSAAYRGAVSPTENYGHHGWTYVRLDQIDQKALELILYLAWAEVAPKRLAKTTRDLTV